ncbi:MAG TPA: efflux RND transporter permease subunit [bacterium]|nr:efflux RND transporter permease subunit [bacterium]HMZ04182.1 efflux RND transporter permease subunit [bacterium]HNB09575.1 efflux RND transporter permease subunit [bacterium]HND77930.1 efflux RND transporter permease subunit [bacterium]HNH32208.1 efflux RND transporter permease subunit [bacterium]
MRIWDFAVDNKVTVYILMMIIVILGTMSYSSLPREAAPDISIPLVIVSVPYVGVSPADMEGLVTQPMEKELKSLKDVKEITSSSKEGLSTIRVEFETGIDIDEALRRVRDKVNQTKPKLPSDILEPIISEINFSEFPIMFVTLGGDLGLARMKRIAEDLQDKIEAVPGVLSSDITGSLEPEVQVNCDINRLKGYSVSFDDVINAIRSENLTTPGGAINNGTTEYSVRIPGEFAAPKPIEDLIIKMRHGSPIYVRDVATVEYLFEDRSTYSRLNGSPVLTLSVKKRAGENLIQIADEVKTILSDEKANFPPGLHVRITNDASIDIKRSVKELENSVVTGMVLVVLVLFMFFGMKNSFLISTSIPISMLIGFVILSFMGVTLNFVVLFALVLVLGILVDDAIVVIENIYRHQHEYGKNPIQAAKDATREVSIPVATSTFTTISGFLPMLFWPGVIGDFMYYLPLTLIIMMGASIFTAYVISPTQGAQFIDYHKEMKALNSSMQQKHWWTHYNPFSRLYHYVDTHFFPRAQEKYVKTLQLTLRHKTMTVVLSGVLLFAMTFLFVAFSKGVEFFPETQPNQVSVNIAMPSGTPLEMTNAVTAMVEERMKHVEGVKDMEFVVANVGTSEDPFDFGGQGTPNKSQISINFYEKMKREKNTFETMESMREHAKGIAGAEIKVKGQENGPPVGAPVSIDLSGDDFRMLAQLSEKIQSEIRSIPGLVDLKDDYDAGKPEIQVIVDREKAALLEMSTGQIAMAVRTAINGTEASKFRVGEDEYKITVRLREDQRQSPSEIENLNITFMNNRGVLMSVPLASIATVVHSNGLSNVRRKDLRRVITISGDVQNRLANDVLHDVREKLKTFKLPNGYRIEYTGENKEMDKAMAFLAKTLVITILLIFLVLVSEFNSVKVPMVIMVSVPLSLIGVFLGLLLTGTPFGVIMTGIGVISLAGIVVKNAIVLLDFTKHLRGSGMTLDEALAEAGRTRLRPVLLTAATTILGILPLASGIDFDWREWHFIIGAESSDFWRPLGVAVIFGLTVSTFLTLVIVPTTYSWVEGITKAVGRWFKRETTV